MIIPKLYGRLGNQCFQIAAAISHAKKMNTQWRIPRLTENMQYWPNYFRNELPRNRLSSIAMYERYNEPRHCFDPLPNNTHMYINGYFQSEKYWPTYEEKYAIGDALGFHCSKKDYVAIHVRRGDYVTQFADKHPPLDLEYYKEAMNHFVNNGDLKFKIYSDDIKWCKKQFPSNWADIWYSNINDPLTDMRDMYNANGFIVANSTFSLFPALLRLDNPVVIAPKEERWYGPGNSHLEAHDLMPERFIKI